MLPTALCVLAFSASVEELPSSSAPESTALTLVTFDGSNTTYEWAKMDDPVMGGQSRSQWQVQDGAGVFNGVCAIVPFLHAPGFCKASTRQHLFHPLKFADASQYIDGALYLTVRSSTPSYRGFKVAFGAKGAKRPRPGMHHAPPSFKADFNATRAWSTVKVPFDAFSVDWSEFTGECSSKDPTGEQHLCCSKAHPEVCPTAAHLAEITSIEVWAEGVEGTFNVEVREVGAGPL